MVGIRVGIVVAVCRSVVVVGKVMTLIVVVVMKVKQWQGFCGIVQ